MAGEIVIITGTAVTLEANGASIANNAVAQADDSDYDIFSQGGNMPDAKFVWSGAFSVAPTESTLISLYARPLNIDGTADAEVPEGARPTVMIGSFAVNNVTSTQYAELLAEDVPWNASYYLHNNGTGQTLSAGWTLKVTPFSRRPAP